MFYFGTNGILEETVYLHNFTAVFAMSVALNQGFNGTILNMCVMETFLQSKTNIG